MKKSGSQVEEEETRWYCGLHCSGIFTIQWLHVSGIFGGHVFVCVCVSVTPLRIRGEEKALNRWPQTDGSVLLYWEKRAGGWTVRQRGRWGEKQMDETRATGMILSHWYFIFYYDQKQLNVGGEKKWYKVNYLGGKKKIHFFYGVKMPTLALGLATAGCFFLRHYWSFTKKIK